MTPREEETAAAFNAQLTGPIDIRLYLSDDPRGKDLQAFCRRLGEIAPNIRTKEDMDETGPLPAIRIGERLRYRGVPAGKELEPFLEAISLLDLNAPSVDATLTEGFDALEAPADLQIFVTPFCGFCPAVLRRLMPLPFAADSVYLTVIDGTLFPDLASAKNIKSVPTLVMDDHLRWTGMVDMDELKQAVINRDPGMLSTKTLERILETEGGAYELAGMMHRHGKVLSAFADLLADERFTIRLAAMVTVEDLMDRDNHMALQLIRPMLDRYNGAPVSVKGDFIYLFGELKAAEALPLMQQAATADPNEEIREAAREALEKVTSD